jgi:hypothetical protein
MVAAGVLLAAPTEPMLNQPAVDTGAQLQAAPDLVIQSITLTPPNPGAGEPADIRVIVRNNGDAAVNPGQSIVLHLYVQPVDDPPTFTTPPTRFYTHGIGLAVGGSFEYTVLGQVIPQANPKIYAWVDRDNLIPELDETNNLFPPPPPPVQPDAYEDDDACQTARVIATDGSQEQRNLAREGGVADEDWVKFAPQSGVRYVVRAEAIGADAHLTLELQASCEGLPSFGAGAVITFTAVTSATHYVRVAHTAADYGPETDYRLSVQAIRPTCNQALEPNNICGVASDLAVNASATSAAFCDPGDVDWLRVAVKAGGQYTVTAANVGDVADVRLKLYASCESDAISTGDTVKFTASTQGYFYVTAEHASPNVFGPETEYRVQATGVGGCDEDAYEPDNAIGAAQRLRINGNGQVHTACPAGDVDWVRFDSASNVTYTVETYNLNSRADTILCLHAASGARLRCDDDGGPGLGSRLIIRTDTAQTQFLSIRDRDPDVAGDETRYEVRVLSSLCQNDANEPDNSLAAAKPIGVDGVARTHSICPADDEDWSVFTAAANTDYTISTHGIGPDADTTIELYDASGQRLAVNDDHTPGTNARIVFRIAEAGAYYVRTQLFNPDRYGVGTEYALSVAAGLPTPTPTPTPQVTPQATPTPGASTQIQTLIVVHRGRIAQLHGEAKTAQLMAKLTELAQSNHVRGEILRIDQNSEIAARYNAWLAEETSVEQANLVADAIRRAILTYLQEREGIRFVVVMGDDRALPFRRVPDGVWKSPEREYLDVDATHATGAAIRNNYYLTDDFFVDREPTQLDGREIYIPDLPIGRLVETPDDMILQIDNFLAAPDGAVQVDAILVTGYDFVNDVAMQNCVDWRKAMNNDNSKVACLIDQPTNHWTKQQLSDHQLRTNPAFKIQSINGHAFHSGQGVASGNEVLRGAEIVAVTGLNFGGGIIYTLGCHSGLNVPPTNSLEPIDLPEAFARRGASYIGNSGFGYGVRGAIGLSEQLMRLYTNELIKRTDGTLGQALVTAKAQYFQRTPVQNFSAFDEKVMQQLIFYGLPMYRITGLQSPGVLGEEFPGVEVEIDPPSLSGEVISTTVRINFQRAIDTGVLSEVETDNGSYLSLNGYTSSGVDAPIQPLHFRSLSGGAAPPRSVIIQSGDIRSSAVADPLIGAPINEYLTGDPDDDTFFDFATGWFPAAPSTLQVLGDQATLVTELAQFNADTGQRFLYRNLQVDVYYSTSSDVTPPEFMVVDGLYDAATRRVTVKVGVVDASGIKEVTLNYIEDERMAATSLQSVKMSFDAAAQKWRAVFTGDVNSLFFVQAVDNAGNASIANNKGNYYRPSQARASNLSGGEVFLPLVTH